MGRARRPRVDIDSDSMQTTQASHPDSGHRTRRHLQSTHCRDCIWCGGEITKCWHPSIVSLGPHEATHEHTWWPDKSPAAAVAVHVCEKVADLTLNTTPLDILDDPDEAAQIADRALDHAVDYMPRTGALPLATMVRTWTVSLEAMATNPWAAPTDHARVPTLCTRGLPSYAGHLFAADCRHEARDFCYMSAMRDAVLADAITKGHAPYSDASVHYMLQILTQWQKCADRDRQRPDDDRQYPVYSPAPQTRILGETQVDRARYAGVLRAHLLSRHQHDKDHHPAAPCSS